MLLQEREKIQKVLVNQCADVWLMIFLLLCRVRYPQKSVIYRLLIWIMRQEILSYKMQKFNKTVQIRLPYEVRVLWDLYLRDRNKGSGYLF